jgi:hypothetical protein
MQKATILSGAFLVLQSEMYKIPIGRLSVLFFGLSEDLETAQFTDIEARVSLTCPGERNASITDGSPYHPPYGKFELVPGPDPVDFALLGLAGGFAAAAHRRDVRLFDLLTLHTAMTDR